MQENKRELEIKTPCHMRWAELEGDRAKRWCDQCALHVVDGASLTRDEARDLVSSADDRVCMRIVRDDRGRIVHADDGSRTRLVGRVLRLGLTAAAGMLVACGDEAKEPAEGTQPDPDGGHVDPTGSEVPEMPPEIMGEVCFPEEHLEKLGDVAYPEEMGSVVVQTEPPISEEESAQTHEMVGRVAFVPEPDTPQLKTPDSRPESGHLLEEKRKSEPDR